VRYKISSLVACDNPEGVDLSTILDCSQATNDAF
jgi:hypothetical protein